MKPGPPPTPLKLRVLRGNPSKRALPANEPQPTRSAAVPEPPSFLSPYARDLWWETAPQLHALRLLTAIDTSCLAAYCESYSTWRTATEALEKMAANDPVMNGQLIKTKFGDVAQNPLISVARRAAADMVRFAAEFGLSPAARARLAAGGYTPPSPPSKIDGLLAGRVVPMRRDDPSGKDAG